MIVAEIMARLEAAGAFALVEGAAELSSLSDAAPPASPAAYVFVDEEAAQENARVGGVLQRVEMDVAVVIMTADVSDATGGAGAIGVETLKAAARSALVGWTPPSAQDVVTFVGSRLARARNGVVTVEMTFATAFYLEA